ncbi:hypothetical protein C8Q78DRAFT_1052556 [Trametes maxima]|nr:hypothetical protein C8Q78DRAFT_1052556 [Trametes maxima]
MKRRSIRLGWGRRAVGGLRGGRRGNVGEYPAWTELMECQRCRVAATARRGGSGRDDRRSGSQEAARKDGGQPQMIRQSLASRAPTLNQAAPSARRGDGRELAGEEKRARTWPRVRVRVRVREGGPGISVHEAVRRRISAVASRPCASEAGSGRCAGQSGGRPGAIAVAGAQVLALRVRCRLQLALRGRWLGLGLGLGGGKEAKGGPALVSALEKQPKISREK